MGWKKITAATTGVAAGAGLGTITLGPVFSGLGVLIGGPMAPITGPLGYGIGCLVTSVLGGVAGDKVGDVVDDE